MIICNLGYSTAISALCAEYHNPDVLSKFLYSLVTVERVLLVIERFIFTAKISMDQTPLSSKPALFSTKLLLPLFGIFVVIAGIIAITVLNKTSQDLRQRAATSTGTVAISLKSPATQFAPGTPQTIEVQTNTGASNVTGYELYIDFTGTVPTDIVYTPTDPAGLSTATSSIEATSTGKRLTIGLLAPIGNPPKSFTTSNATVTLGKLTFTAPTTGTMSVSMVPQLSRALLFNSDPAVTTETDVLKTAPTYSYTFGATARPSATPIATTGTQGGTASPRPIVCYGKVILNGSTPMWPDGCRGTITSGVCTQVLSPLTADEVSGYNAWISAGRPSIPGCPATPKPTVTPTKPPVGGLPSAPPGCVYKTVTCFQAPCDPILVCSTPTPVAQVPDDLFFAPETESNSIFWFYEPGTRTFVPSNGLVIGRTYSVEIDPQIQNKVKTTAIDNRNLQIGLRINGSILDTANNFYSLVSNHASGAGFHFAVNFVAKATNKLEVVIDPYNVITETNEANNIFTRSFNGVTSTPAPSATPNTTCAMTTVTNTFATSCIPSDAAESTFQWKPVPGATEYAFTFLNANNGVMLSLGYTPASTYSCTSTACKKTIALRSDYVYVVVHARGTCQQSNSQAVITRVPLCTTPTPLRTCASQGGVCRSKSGVCGDGAYNYATSSDCTSTQNCCVPINVPTPFPTPTSIPVACVLSNIVVNPTEGWTRTPSFTVTNTASKSMTFNWKLDAWADNTGDKAGTTTLLPGQKTTLGLGNICSRWSLNVSCSGSAAQKGYVVEPFEPACAQVTPRPTVAPTPAPTVRPATPTPRPIGGITAEQWNRLPQWLRDLIARFL